MQIVSTLVWAALGQSVLANTRQYAPLNAPRRAENAKRLPQQSEVLSCSETYGPGSMACGKPDLRLCFNPTAGESCCGVDGGFCEAGFHCAPVPSFCCKDGEDLETCARNAGFALPTEYSAWPISESVTSSASVSAVTLIADHSTLSSNGTVHSFSPITAAATTATIDCDDEDLTTSFREQVLPALTSSTTYVAPATTSHVAAAATDDEYTFSFEPAPTIAQVQPTTNYTLPIITPVPQPSTTVKPIVAIAGAPSGARPPSAGGAGWSYVLAVGAVMVVMAF
ncbi:uncharacterized protein B0I36DRAFT_405731 [Microdochium trichocladiopsis]|uniref:GPI anchored protein n=1 Tax=Microdochium trichocladiopsis TaxID=1682393 RepID=A0A9P9BQR8_9PEZI|nr:uncharacterized protein B0I36DRAFT_405731 [Microdochium trichocladiopsis]KAH7035173.1 hypothetical protein B0I36DRAFT_405731 [Microdochium trichocladiopsis]